MATASRHTGPHGSGASLEEMRGWRSFLHLASELKLSRLARLAYPYRRRAVLSVLAMVVITLSGLAVPYLLSIAIDRAPEPTPDSRTRAPGKMSASIRIGPRSFG